jgi:hypothetical protein
MKKRSVMSTDPRRPGSWQPDDERPRPTEPDRQSLPDPGAELIGAGVDSSDGEEARGGKSRFRGALDRSRQQIAEARESAKAKPKHETFAGVTLWSDGRVEAKHQAGGHVAGAQATVETQGQIRGRRTVKTLGMHQKKIDERELFLSIEGQGWAISAQVDPKDGAEAREFAAKVNTAGMTHQAADISNAATSVSASTSAASLGRSVAEELKQLADLRDAGVLTEEEFTAQKVIVLSGAPRLG